jgi:uncharacterized protein (TIGR02646 family)
VISVPISEPSLKTQQTLSDLSAEFEASTKPSQEFWSSKRARLRDPALELAAVFNKKCAYCESKPEAVSYANIEHFRPKKSYPSEMFVWANWMYACVRCNVNKGEFWSADLLSVFVDDVAQSLGFMNAVVDPRDERGEATVGATKLDRPDLEIARREQLNLLAAIIGAGGSVTDPDDREVLTMLAAAALGPDAPYASAARHLFGEQPEGHWPSYELATERAFPVLVKLAS